MQPWCCRPLPDEEGTERLKSAPSVARSRRCRPLPDEEGTESDLTALSIQMSALVADRSPMRRGLKGWGMARMDGIYREVADRSPMRRGLKAGVPLPTAASFPRCRPLPD